MNNIQFINSRAWDISGIIDALDKALTLVLALAGDYFSSTSKYHEKNGARELIKGYDQAATFNGIVFDYLLQIEQDLKELETKMLDYAKSQTVTIDQTQKA